MTKTRVVLFFITLVVVGSISLIVSFYARGYKFNTQTLRFTPNGLLVIKSEPDGASVYVNGDLKTATNATISMAPGIYDIEVKKDGYLPWYKRMEISKEVVTQATVSLFRSVPSLSPVTYSGAQNPIASKDGTKIAYTDKDGLWTIDTFNLPLGFSNDPKRITDGNLTGATYNFSPDGRQIMLNVSNSIFVVDSGSFTPQSQRVNMASQKASILSQWQKEDAIKNNSLTRNLPPDLTDILDRKTSKFTFSPDENMILYTASASGSLADNLIPPLPGASTQKQERSIQAGHTYVYDIKEDRNFVVTNRALTETEAVRWMPDSRHLLLGQDGNITIMDYDGTNRQVVYSGSYIAPFAFPFSNANKILILTNLGSADSFPNLYTLTVK